MASLSLYRATSFKGLIGNLILFLRVLYLVCALPFLLRFLSIDKLCKWFTPKYPRLNLDKKEKVIQYINLLFRPRLPILRGSCLKRTLLLYKFLREMNIGVRFNVGLKEYQGYLLGHSWLTLGGKPYLTKREEMIETYKINFIWPPDK